MNIGHKRVTPALGALLVCLGASARPAAAQWLAGFTGGVIVPVTGPLVREIGGVNGVPVPYPTIEKWQVNGLVLTARATHLTPRRLGLEVSLGSGLTNVATRDSLNLVQEAVAAWVLSSVRVPLKLNHPKPAAVGFYVAPGVGYQWHAGRAWNGYGHRGALAAVLSLGARAQVKPRSKVWLRLEVEDYFSRQQFSLAGARLQSRFHHSLIFSFGLSFTVKKGLH